MALHVYRRDTGLGGAETGSVCFSGSLFVFLITVFGHADLAADRVVCQMEEAVFDFVDWGSDIFYPLTGTTKKWPESFNNADFGHFTD
jgi:hypothetical protein